MRFPAFLAAALMIGACSSTSQVADVFDSRQNAGPCPSSGSVYGAERIVEFSDAGSGSYNNITFTGEIVGVKLYCRYVEGDPILAEVLIDFAFGRGPAATSDVNDYTYFVAVTRRNRTILQKERFVQRVDFDGQKVTGVRETIDTIRIPRVDETISGANFEILIGFDLTDEQLQFNRDGKRYRLDAGSN